MSGGPPTGSPEGDELCSPERDQTRRHERTTQTTRAFSPPPSFPIPLPQFSSSKHNRHAQQCPAVGSVLDWSRTLPEVKLPTLTSFKKSYALSPKTSRLFQISHSF